MKRMLLTDEELKMIQDLRNKKINFSSIELAHKMVDVLMSSGDFGCVSESTTPAQITENTCNFTLIKEIDEHSFNYGSRKPISVNSGFIDYEVTITSSYRPNEFYYDLLKDKMDEK